MVEAYDQIESGANLYDDDSAEFTQFHFDEIKIYPNPSDDFIIIKGEEKIDYQVQIFGVFGNKIKEFSFTKQSQIDVSTWTSGLYMMRIENSITKNITPKSFMVRQ